MIRSTRFRQVAQSITGLVYVAIAAQAALFPGALAQGLGYTLHPPNGYSEFFAVYVGVWSATAILAFTAVRRPAEPTYGDLLATFVLAQPIARCLAIPMVGLPSGVLFWMFVLETVGAVLLFAVRPSPPPGSP